MKDAWKRFIVYHPVISILSISLIICLILIAAFVGMILGFIYNPILTFTIMGGIVLFCFIVIAVCMCIEAAIKERRRKNRWKS